MMIVTCYQSRYAREEFETQTNAYVPLNGILTNFLLMKEITSYFNTNTSFVDKPCSQQV